VWPQKVMGAGRSLDSMSHILSSAGSPGAVWTVGNAGALGRANFRNRKLDRIQTVLPPIRQIACDLGCNLLFTVEGDVFVSGSGSEGCFGFDRGGHILIATRSQVSSNLRPFLVTHKL
jgi:hypothetical protein